MSLLPERLRIRLQPHSHVGKKRTVDPGTLLTGTQVGVRTALVAALLEPTALIVLTGAAGLGKTSVLTAALESVSDPLMQVIQLDDGEECGMDQSFEALFNAARCKERRPGLSGRRIVLVADQAETLPPGIFGYLELLTRMPGKGASVQLVIVGRPRFQDCIGDPVADWFQDTAPVHLVLAPLSEQDAWSLFHHRVSPAHAPRSVRRVVMMLLERSGGVPGRFDQALQAAVAGGLLEGALG